MKKIKHSKLKNTGILFELLVRQITTDTLNNVAESKAGNIIRTYFHKNSNLSKELALYHTLVNEKFNSDKKAESLIEACKSARRKINNTNLSREKYNLIKSIKEAWNIDDFFSARVSNYKVLASVYTLFEYKTEDNPKHLVSNKYTLIEHIASKKQKETTESSTIIQEDKDIRHLTYKLLVEKFNSKYKSLDLNQKKLLENFILNVSNTNNLKEYFGAECVKVAKKLTELNKSVDDAATKIKITESINLLKNMNQNKIVKDDEVLAMLRYYELVKELKSTLGVK